MSTRIQEDACPACSSALDAASDLDGDDRPKEGDVSVCFYCAAVLQFDADLRLRVFEGELEDDVGAQVALVVRHVKASPVFGQRPAPRSRA